MEQAVTNLEAECQYLRSLVLPQHAQSASFNQTSAASRQELTVADQDGGEIGPMKMERNSPMRNEAQELPDNE